MQRLLNEVRAYVCDLASSAVSSWNAFFFSPADPSPLGLIRVGVGALLFWNIAVLGFDLHDFLGSDGWISAAAIRQYHAEHTPGAWSIWFLVSDRGLVPAWVCCLAVTALFTVGFASRITAVLAWIAAVSIDRRAPVAAFGFDHMISTWTFYLAAFGASGQALSIDRRRAADGPPPATISANLTLRMIQLHLALVYGSAGLSKLMGPEWWDGTAMGMLLLTPEFKRWDLSWLLAYPMLLNFATHLGVALEIAYPVAIWNRRLRPLLLFSIACMHFGIDLLLGLTEFGLAMIVANLAFIPGAWLQGLRAPAPAAVRGAGISRPAAGHARRDTVPEAVG